MQHPVGYEKAADGSVELSSFWALVLNLSRVVAIRAEHVWRSITGAFVMASVGAFQHVDEVSAGK
jgi:cytochrome bd-type quinol oxidase subunit 1